MLDDDFSEDQDADDEAIEKRDAEASAALSALMAKSRSGAKLSKYEATRLDWRLVGDVNGVEFYLGTIHTETMYKDQKAMRGKIKLYDEFIRGFRNGNQVLFYKVKYVGGFRESIPDAVSRISSRLKV